MNEKPTHIDLFSGIGGFSLAFESVGFETIGFAEIDPYASAVLKKHWPSVTNYGDVRTVPAIKCDVITGGFPCQPFSVAGKRRGAADDRFLWPAMLDVIARCKPAWVLGENVPGIVGMELDRVLADLEGIGFRTQSFIVPACGVDAKHKRDRLWILANSDCISSGTFGSGCLEETPTTEIASTGKQSRIVAHSEGMRWIERGANRVGSRKGTGTPRERSGPSNGNQILANSNGAGSQRRNSAILQQCPGEWIARTSNPRPEQSSIWKPEPELGRVANGIPNRAHRLRGLGNAIVPQVAQVFARAIYKIITNP